MAASALDLRPFWHRFQPGVPSKTAVGREHTVKAWADSKQIC